MEDITDSFGTLYYPKSALVFYETTGTETDMYVEHFDMDENGTPVNAHPLSVKEAEILAKALQTDEERSRTFLKPKGILPTNILHINPSDKGSVIWYTKAQKRQLYFVESLGIPNGMAQVPPLLWKANKNSLTVFALATNRRPTEKTLLHYAPFFNIYEKGNVCMGTVSIDIKNSASVEEFIQAWEDYFFNSYFSHSLSANLTKTNIISLWKDIINTEKPFPIDVLKKNNKTLKKSTQMNTEITTFNEQSRTKIHFTDNYLLNPTNPISVNLIGAGGTGSKVLTALMEMSHSLIELGHAGLQVRLWDDDIITTANLGRQRFFDSEKGLYKSVALINRVNRCIGTNWKAETRKFEKDSLGRIPEEARATITITCVDNVQARFEVAETLKEVSYRRHYQNDPKYWLDYGNSQHTGQVILSTIGEIQQPKSEKYETVGNLPFVTDEFEKLLKESETQDDTPSCSLADALKKQDLFINSSLTQMGCSLLWSLFRNGMTPYRGFFHNLKDFRTQPVTID